MANKAIPAHIYGVYGTIAVFVFFGLSLALGEQGWAWSDLLLELRLPRALMAVAVGAGLAVSGAILQALFSNPLCEPYTLGVSSGAALGAVLGAWIGLPMIGAGLTGSALLGSLAFSFLLHGASLRMSGSRSSLLLTGVMLGFFGSSLVAMVIAFSDPAGIQGALYWLLGDLSRARLSGSVFSCIVSLILCGVLWSSWRPLDALLLGDEGARALGVPVDRVRRRLLFVASLLIGLCVSGAGMVGFIGLVIPHFARRKVGSLHFKLIPVCAIWGAAALLGSDLASRLLTRSYELPVGVVTALLGAPVFFMILVKGDRKNS